jgi:hypothetical protein
MLCPLHYPWLNNSNCTRQSTHYDAPQYAFFSNLLSLHPSLVQIVTSAHCSQTPSVYIPPLMSETSFTPIDNHRQNYSFVCSDFYVFRQQMGRQKVLHWMVGSITWISPLNFLLNQILFCYCHSQIFELRHISKGSISYPYCIILPCILVTRYQRVLSFICIYF